MALPCVTFYSWIVLFSVLLFLQVSGECTIPSAYEGYWYSQEYGIMDIPFKLFGMECRKIHTHSSPESREMVNVTMLMKMEGPVGCYHCVHVVWRTPNVLQYKKGDCLATFQTFGIDVEQFKVENVCRSITEGLSLADGLKTLFKLHPTPTNCESTTEYEAMFQFSYEFSWSEGPVCDNPNSMVRACEKKGDRYDDNTVFQMNLQACPDVTTSLNKSLTFGCMGSWTTNLNGQESTFAAIFEDTDDIRERYKCMITDRSQFHQNGLLRWGMSRFADCSSLQSVYDAPIRLVLQPDLEATERTCK